MNKELIAGVLLSSLGFAAFAQTTGTTGPFSTDDTGTSIDPPLTTVWDTDSPPPPPMQLPKFNTGLPGVPPTAVLESVTIEVDGFGSLFWQGENLSETATVTGDINIFGHLDVFAPCGACAAETFFIDATAAVDLTTFDGSIDFGGPSGTTLGPFTDASTATINVAASDFGLYEGPGLFDLRVVATSGDNSASVGGALLTFREVTAGSRARVTYGWSAPEEQMPVPAPLALLAAGIIGIAATRRRA
jgi:hypothetical protein